MSELDALQQTLAGEHAAVWVYGVLGGQASRRRQPRLYADVTAAYGVHRARRDQLIRTVTDLGGEPVASEVGYGIPADLGSTAAVAATALGVEQRCAATYAALVAQTVDAHRRWAVTALTDAAIRQLRFRGSPEIFPGAGDLADR
jgi:hypothetical protein